MRIEEDAKALLACVLEISIGDCVGNEIGREDEILI